ncbi:MAG: Hpt domain-containing protein, partial [Thermomonas sp.]|uniref:Hpt domain-containing protein n=1 Tax=Thermomonas sp. TaxID=1971895 RepID=UPI001EC01984
MTTALRDAIDHTALGWVKPEIDEALRQSRIELEAYEESPSDPTPMRTCLGHLHQVYGTLRMLELQTPAMVVREMEELAMSLLDGSVTSRNEGLTALMRGVVQLPDYLERLQGGHRDIPIVLLPLINALRVARNAAALEQSALPSLLVAPTDEEIEHARGSLAGRNRALLDTVAAAIKEDLLKVKDALDLFLRGSRSDMQELQSQADALGRVAETLGMIGLDSAKTVVQEQRSVVQEIASGARPSSESDLLDVAGALLYIDHSLDDQVAQLGSTASTDGLQANESRKVMEALVRAAMTNFAEVRSAFVAFVETGWDHAALATVPRLLTEVGGALQMLDRREPVGYLEALRIYCQRELLENKQVLGGKTLDTLADALASFEYYLESLQDPHGLRLDMLEKTRISLAQLQYWPIPAMPEPVTTTVQQEPESVEAEPAAEVVAETHDVSVVAETDEPVLPTASTVAVIPQSTTAIDAGFVSMGEEIDDEIRDIFLEEFQEEIGNLDTLLPEWRLAPDDIERLRPIRRVFHTLKGSGRLVGAKVLGEFSWHVESMLNRVLDGSRPASRAVVAFVDKTHGVLPSLHSALRGEAACNVDIPAMEAVADRIAAGEDVLIDATPMIAAATAPSSEVIEAAVPANVATEAGDAFEAVTVDPVLLEVLVAEVGGHLSTFAEWLGQAKTGDAQASDALVRALHTLNGAFAMTEVPSVTAVTAPAESYAKRLLAAKVAASAAGVAALAEAADAVRASTDALQFAPTQVPRYPELAGRLAELRDSLPEAALPFGGMALVDHAAEDAAREEAERLAAQEAARAEAERLAAEEAARAEAERLAAEEAARAEAERLAAEEAERAEAERLAAEEAARAEAERLAAEEAARAEAERLAAEEAERAEAERLA